MLKVLVYGATGSQAMPTVTHLIKNGHRPIVVTRNPENASDLKAAGATIVKGDLADAESLHKISAGVDAVAFLLPAFLGETDDAVAFGRNAINAAIECGAKTFVWNASGPIPDDAKDAKYQILRYLENSHLNWVVFEPTTYMENWLGPWTAPSVKRENMLTYPVLKNVKMGWLASDDMGKLVAAAIEQPGTNGRFNVSGVESPTGSELSVAFSEALGRDINYRTMAPEEMGAAIDAAFGAGVGDRIAEMYRAEQNDLQPEPKYHDMEPVLERFPVEMTTIQTWVKNKRGEF